MYVITCKAHELQAVHGITVQAKLLLSHEPYMHARFTCIYMHFQAFTCIYTNLYALHAKLVDTPLSNTAHVGTVPDDWMTKAETSRLYELAPKPRLFVRPITAILGKTPMVRAGSCPWSVRETQARFRSACAATSGHIIQEELESVILQQIWRTVAGCGTSTSGR